MGIEMVAMTFARLGYVDLRIKTREDDSREEESAHTNNARGKSGTVDARSEFPLVPRRLLIAAGYRRSGERESRKGTETPSG